MGHALLRTTYESKSERQPANVDDRYWIVADARLDAREELLDELTPVTNNCFVRATILALNRFSTLALASL